MRAYVFLLGTMLVGATVAYPAMAPVEQYRIANSDEEIALARSAAPESISAKAQVLVLGRHGYLTAVKGTNGFVCLVERSWAASFNDPQFWNPKLRGPACFNAAAVRTELPQLLKRTEWVLAGISNDRMKAQTRAAFVDHAFQSPAPGAFSFMLSKRGYVDPDNGGPWLPHVMFYVSSGQAKVWGAGLPGSPVVASINDDTLGSTILMIPVRRWSDGTPAPPPTP